VLDLRQWWRRAGGTIWRRGAEGDLAREIAAHRQLAHDEFRRRGLSEDDARAAADRAVGRADLIGEHQREARMFRLVDDLGRDVRHALRLLRRTPAMTAVAILSLAIGIGANTVAFSVVDRLLLQTLPVPSPERLVNVQELWPGSAPRTAVPYWEFIGLRDGAGDAITLAALSLIDRSNIRITGPTVPDADPGRARVAMVSGNYFSVLGTTAAIGRTLTPNDDRTQQDEPVVVISDAFWTRALRRTADVLNHSASIYGTAFRIVGVAAAGFQGDWTGRPVDLWVATLQQSRVVVEHPTSVTQANDYWLRLVGRLAPGVGPRQAEQALAPVYQRVMRTAAGSALTDQDAQEIARQRLDLQPGARGYSPQVDTVSSAITTLTAVAALALFVVCANIAGLLLSRSAIRRREFAVRLAIGAGGRRLTRQLLTEGVVLAAIGGLLGLLLALWGTRAVTTALATAPVEMFWGRASWISFDAPLSLRALLFTGLTATVAGLIFAIAPVRRASRTPLASALSARMTGGDARRPFLAGRALVALQVALALVVIVAAGLLARSLVALRHRDLGFTRDQLMLVWTQPSATGLQGAALKDLWQRARDRVLSVPGVAAVGASNSAILSGTVRATGRAQEWIRVEGLPRRTSPLPGGRTFISPQYFEALGVPMLEGREFTDSDNGRQVVILNESIAQMYFGHESPLGRHIGLGPGPTTPFEVIGVAKNFENGSPRGADREKLSTFFPYRADTGANLIIMCLAVRTRVDPRAVMPSVRAALHEATPDLPVLSINTVEDQLDDVLAKERLVAGLSSFFGAVAGLLACLGVYGLLAQMTSNRTTELGVRMALGATGSGVLRMVLMDGVALVGAGVVLGVLVSVGAMRILRAQLFGVGPTDGWTMAAGVAVLVSIALFATWLPARRAARADPMAALREG
jgi:predicted permease